MSVRLRVAPSPTGAPHVGTAYVAIFNLAFARQQGGEFLLRIEDTDQGRSEAQYETMIFESLRWLGLGWDEGPDIGGPHGPYRQSERSAIYAEQAQTLIARGTAYYCFCTRERLTRLRDEQKAAKSSTLGYDRLCRGLSPAEAQARKTSGEPYVVRLKVPTEGEMTFTDLIRGDITIGFDQLDDQVLLKEDGFPTYHLANVVDDHLMGITHVMRAEEWISSTPKHILLYQAFGWDPPGFAHLPLLRNKDRTKISKRKNPVSLKWYEEEGYLAEAMVNFLALMGFSLPDGREIFGFADVVESFSFSRINSAGPVFDLDKLAWLNGEYMRKLSADDLIGRMRAIGMEIADDAYTRAIVPLVQERMKLLKDFTAIGDYFFKDDLTYDPTLLVPKKRNGGETAAALERFARLFRELDEAQWSKDGIEQAMRAAGDELGWSAKETFMAVRVAVTGKTATPPLIESILVLGRDRTARRVGTAAEALHAPA
jgi:glutamyl-tRNA synthetase